jgi:lipopolysaccharide transport system permease protein
LVTSDREANLADSVISEIPSLEKQQITVIQAGKQEKLYWQDLWRCRELLYILSMRDIMVRYKQTVIGIAWSVFRPLLLMLAMTFTFHSVAHLQSPGVPYGVFVMAGLIPWQFFTTALTESSNSLVAQSQMISKIYFPRLLIPVSAVMVSFVDAMIGFAIFLCMMAFYHYVPTWRILTLPIFIMLTFLPSIGLGIWFGALNVKYRDFRYIVPFLVQIGFYVSPVAYSAQQFHNRWVTAVFYVNPMAGIIDGWRWALCGGHLNPWSFSLAVCTSIVIFSIGLWYFRRTERYFVDSI